ncbi:hypothetical protein KUTeg_018209, partial [Tegillarca granosa]
MTHVKSIPVSRKFGYSIGHTLNDLTAAVWFSYLIAYFYNVRHFDSTLAGVCFIVVSFPFIFTEVIDFTNWSKWTEFVFYAIAVIFFQYGWASVQVSHLSMIPELTMISTLFVYLLAWLLFYLQKGKKENSQLNEEDGDVFRVAVIYMCTRLVVNISQIYIPMYITESLEMPKESLAIVPLVVYVSQFLMALLIKKENKTLGRNVTYILGQMFTLGACLWIYFINKENINQVYGVAIFIGIGGSTVLVTSLAMTSDLIGQNLGSGAFVYGCVSFTDKLGNGIAIVLIQNLNPC